MKNFELIESGTAAAELHMQRDATLLSTLKERAVPCVHHYDWAGVCLTYGYFIDPDALVCLEEARRRDVHLARRPTGGGALLHHHDLSFSVLVPASCPQFSTNTLANYALINEAVKRAIAAFLRDEDSIQLSQGGGASAKFCRTQHTPYDLLFKGRKVGGSAQRRTQEGFLHQSSLFLGEIPSEMTRALLCCGKEVAEASALASTCLLPGSQKGEIQQARQELRFLLNENFQQLFG